MYGAEANVWNGGFPASEKTDPDIIGVRFFIPYFISLYHLQCAEDAVRRKKINELVAKLKI